MTYDQIIQEDTESVSHYGERFLDAHKNYIKILHITEENELPRLAKRKFRGSLRNVKLRHEVTYGEVDGTSLKDYIKTTVTLDTAHRNEEYNRVSTNVIHESRKSLETNQTDLLKQIIDLCISQRCRKG